MLTLACYFVSLLFKEQPNRKKLLKSKKIQSVLRLVLKAIHH